MRKIKVVLFLIISVFVISACQKQVRVVCVGDSITEGAGTKVWNESSYPVILNGLMGENYEVKNCGRSGATLLKESDFSFWDRKEFNHVFAFQPEIITISLGTNDAKDNNWNAERYEKDYQSLIDTFRTIKANPKIYMCLPPPAFERRWNINDTTIREQVIPIINKLADKNKLEVIDLYSNLQDQGENFPDGIHPNETGAAKIAEVICEVLKEGCD